MRLRLARGIRLRFNAARLRELRVRKGWTLEALSVRSGVSERAIQDLETGVTQRPRPNTVRWLAEALDEQPQTLWIDEEVAGQVLEALPSRATVLVYDEQGNLLNRVGAPRDAVQIGRDARNDVVLPSPLVSLFHALVAWREGGFLEVRDLGSSNGTWVGERRVDQPRKLEFGEAVGIGPFVLEMRRLEESLEIPIETLRVRLSDADGEELA
jgi:transcriptional regulator with XRE-family HTH domain